MAAEATIPIPKICATEGFPGRDGLEERAAIIADGELTDYRDPSLRKQTAERLAAQQHGFKTWRDAVKAARA